MFGIGLPELMIVLVVAVIMFGGAKLPQIGRSLGKGIKEFKKVVKEMKEGIE
jgi:TatA/E family protein of Tat protein translocase